MENQNIPDNNIEGFTPVEACRLTSKEQVIRYQELKNNLFSKIAEIHELPDGYELIFNEEIAFSARLIDFINFERECCPSFTFGLTFKPDGGPIHLEIKGSKGIKDMVALDLKEKQLNKKRLHSNNTD